MLGNGHLHISLCAHTPRMCVLEALVAWQTCRKFVPMVGVQKKPSQQKEKPKSETQSQPDELAMFGLVLVFSKAVAVIVLLIALLVVYLRTEFIYTHIQSRVCVLWSVM